MKRLIDIHNHTIASGHAYSTLQEMVRAAAEAGIEYFGITDHAPSLPGAIDPMYFRNFGVIPREMYGVRLLMGCELNILDSAGTIDLDERHYSFMDIRLAGIHKLCWTPGTKEKNTEGVLNVMRNKWVNVITHPAGFSILCATAGSVSSPTRATEQQNSISSLSFLPPAIPVLYWKSILLH